MNETINTNWANIAVENDHEYPHLEARIRESFEAAVNSGEPMFDTDVSNLYDLFLEEIPAEHRQHYNCHACRRFVNNYGGLVTIDDDGVTHPVMWKFEYPEFFAHAVSKVYSKVKRAKVIAVFITSDKRLGVARTGVWTHMSVDVPKAIIYKSRLKTADQAMDEKNQEFLMLMRATNNYSLKTVETAVNLLRSESLYRSEKVLGIAEWFLKVKNLQGKYNYTNRMWKMVATAPAGFCHISSSMIGTLLDDIQEGYSLNTVKDRFDRKMNPLKYQRPQSAPSMGNVLRAEEIVRKLGIVNSLKRRFARLEELNLLWQPRATTKAPAESLNVFAGIKTKRDNQFKRTQTIVKGGTMTFEKFARTVLPQATKIEMWVDGTRRGYAGLVTAEDFDAPPIVQWDTEENRNPVSWYFHAGGSYPRDWGLNTGEYVKVTGIALQPNMWQEGYEHQGQGVFLILKGCKDEQNSSSALFPEILKSDLREIRATIEAYSRNNKLGGADEATACGLGLQAGSDKSWGVKLRVTTDIGVTTYELDRWD